jgi:PAS domain S-box-containing protein/excisionase family DNA binding protein
LLNKSQVLSVMEIAGICGVARSTVSYWIAEKSLPAHRSGRKHMVSVKDLIPFLESEGHPMPKSLLGNPDGIYHKALRPFKPCWEYWSHEIHREGCESCPMFSRYSMPCFTAKHNSSLGCRIDCAECGYFYEYYAPAMSFIHQIKNPSAIYKDLYIWSGNRAWADLCGVETKTLIGAGAEEFIHSESLKKIINYDKKIRMGDNSEVFRFDLVFISKNGKKIKTDLSISPLRNPDGTWLAVVERQCQP